MTIFISCDRCDKQTFFENNEKVKKSGWVSGEITMCPDCYKDVLNNELDMQYNEERDWDEH